mgnify:CR=1 FL=1
MTISKVINMVAVVFTAICTLFVSSCEDPVDDRLDIALKSTTITSDAGQVFVSVTSATSWTLYMTAEDGGSEVDWASLNVTSGTGNKSNVILTYKANGNEDSRSLSIVVDNGRNWARCTFTQPGLGQQGGEDEPLPQPELDLTKTGWLELPAMDDPDLGYYSHSFEMNGQKYRNYSFGWSQEDLVALWVAYPLCSMYTNKRVSRTDEWAYDPVLGPEYSSAPFGGYGGSYARGHQVPSADRLCCREANVQTFYGTNMTPQLNGHNGGIWQDIESYVRNIANTSDTTYVVSGCMVKDSQKFTQDSDGKKMTVPTAYFKAVLRYSKSSTLSTWAAMAFYTEHKDYPDNTPFRTITMSVDSLETVTGLDFFVNLPDKLGEKRAKELEAEDPATNSVWGL